jgi:hypothetical protein
MKALTFVAGALCLAGLPSVASASCFYVFSAQNQLVYRSTISPIDLSRPISEGLKGPYSGGHLTMTPDETGCPDLIANRENQASGIFGVSNNNERSVSSADVMPVMRNIKSVGPNGSSYAPPVEDQSYGKGNGMPGRSGSKGR